SSAASARASAHGRRSSANVQMPNGASAVVMASPGSPSLAVRRTDPALAAPGVESVVFPGSPLGPHHGPAAPPTEPFRQPTSAQAACGPRSRAGPCSTTEPRSAGNLPGGAFAWSEDMPAKGILGRKLGMTQVWDADN